MGNLAGALATPRGAVSLNGEMKGVVQEEDYCFECKRWIDTDDPEHQEHEKLSNRIGKPSGEVINGKLREI